MLIVRRSETRGEVMETTKTDRRLRIPLPTELMDILRDHVDALPDGAMRASELLFPSTSGGFRAAANVHDFVVRAISGHATTTMLEHYSSVSGNEVRSGLAKVIALAGIGGRGAGPLSRRPSAGDLSPFGGEVKRSHGRRPLLPAEEDQSLAGYAGGHAQPASETSESPEMKKAQ